MKRLIFITGDKGGVGKSFTARTLVQYYLDHHIPFRAYDIDPVNPNLSQFYPETTIELDIEQPGALDQLRNDLEAHDLLVVDCAARSINELDKWFHEISLFQEKHALRLAMTFVFVITPDKSCTVIMKDALVRFGQEADYLLVKNTGKGLDFSIYDNSTLRKSLGSDYRTGEITLPVLLERTVVHLDQLDVSFGGAMNHPQVAVADRSRIRGYLERVYEQFRTHQQVLVPGKVAQTVTSSR